MMMMKFFDVGYGAQVNLFSQLSCEIFNFCISYEILKNILRILTINCGLNPFYFIISRCLCLKQNKTSLQSRLVF